MNATSYWCDECREREQTPDEALELKYRCMYVDLTNVTPSLEALVIMGEEWIRQNKAAPLEIDRTRCLVVAMVNPFDCEARDQIVRAYGSCMVETLVCTQESFDEFLLRAFTGGPTNLENVK